MKIESLNCRIWGRLREGRFPANGAKIHPSAFILHPCSLAGLVIEVDGDVHDLQKEEDERREPPLSFGLLRDPPNTTMKIRDEN